MSFYTTLFLMENKIKVVLQPVKTLNGQLIAASVDGQLLEYGNWVWTALT